MKHSCKFFILLTLLTFVHSCSSDNKPLASNNSNQTSTNTDGSKKRADNSSKDEDFPTFLKQFSTDEAFQYSRINFPMKVRTIGDNSELEDEVMTKKQWHQVNFNYDQNNPDNEYEQKVKINNDNAVIECRGIGNGIMADYYFEKKNGLWFLVNLTDAST